MSNFEEKYDQAVRSWVADQLWKDPSRFDDVRNVEFKTDGGYYYSELTYEEGSAHVVCQIKEERIIKKGKDKGSVKTEWPEVIFSVEGDKVGPWVAKICSYVNSTPE